MRSVAGVALIAPARGRASKKIISIMHTGAARCFWKPKWPWVKTKPPKPSTTGRAVCNARFLLREVHVSGALSGACTGKGPQIANPRPTPKPGNLGPPWPPGTSGDPAGYSRGRPLGGSDYPILRAICSGHGYPPQRAVNTSRPRSDRFRLLELRVARTGTKPLCGGKDEGPARRRWTSATHATHTTKDGYRLGLNHGVRVGGSRTEPTSWRAGIRVTAGGQRGSRPGLS